MATYDLILRNGTLVDGSGGPRRAADVAVKGDRIAAIGAPGSLRGDNEIDAAGRIVAPGFIDVHTHDDTALIGNPCMAMKASKASRRWCAAIAASAPRPISARGRFRTTCR